MAHLLEALGVGAVEDAVYRELLRLRRGDAASLAAGMSLPVDAVAEALDSLSGHGLVQRASYDRPDFAPVDPDIAVTQLIQQRRRDLLDLQLKVEDLAADLRPAASSAADSPVEVVRGRDAVLSALALVTGTARSEVLLVDSAPYIDAHPAPNDLELSALARGVEFRAVYHPSALVESEARTFMRDCVRAGEDARLHRHAGPKMTIADRRLAILLASSSDPDPEVRLLVRPSPLLDALVATFEDLWRRAAPIGSSGPGEELPERDRHLLSLLAAGMRDHAIAHTLGVTERTVRRRITELMERLDAGTRFRAGIRAVQRGWISAD